VSINIDSFNLCSGSDSVRLVLKNNELSPSTSASNFTVLLPFGVEYIAATERFYNNPFTSTVPTITMDGNQQRLTWASDGVPANDSAVWAFDYTITDSIGMCGLASFEAESTTEFSATCGGTSCNSSIVNSSGSDEFIVSRPILNVTSNTSSIQHDTVAVGINDSLTTSVSINNTGYEGTDMKIRAYQDVNANGIVDGGDVLLYDVDKPFVGSTFSFDTLLVASNGTYTCPVVTEIIPECDCDNDTIVSASSCTFVAVPVELTYFRVNKLNDNVAQLMWQTASEINSERFVIERRLDGQNSFEKVGEVLAQGNSSQLVDYVFNDDIKGFKGSICYRLKQIDFDGAYAYSNVQCIKSESSNELIIYPNPTDGLVSIVLHNEDNGSVAYTLYDSKGQVVLEQKNEPNTLFTIDLRGFADGVYILKSTSTSVVRRLIKVSK